MTDRRIWTIPNALSLLRLLMLIPIFYFLAVEKRITAGLLMVASAITDNMDGFIARRLNQCSDLGRIMDPVIDKVSVLGVAIFMVLHPVYSFPLWFCAFLVLREAMILAGGLWIVRRRSVVLESNRYGKISAFATAAAVLLFVWNWMPYAWILLGIALLLTLCSTYSYWNSFQKALQSGS